MKNTTRILLVTGGDDFHATAFEEAYGGTAVEQIIDNLSDFESDDWELEVHEFEGSIDPNFISFIRNTIQDYDQSKSINFYVEGSTI